MQFFVTPQHGQYPLAQGIGRGVLHQYGQGIAPGGFGSLFYNGCLYAIGYVGYKGHPVAAYSSFVATLAGMGSYHACFSVYGHGYIPRIITIIYIGHILAGGCFIALAHGRFGSSL
jgi:hypothetical protein